jgi:hypothetical protein
MDKDRKVGGIGLNGVARSNGAGGPTGFCYKTLVQIALSNAWAACAWRTTRDSFNNAFIPVLGAMSLRKAGNLWRSVVCHPVAATIIRNPESQLYKLPVRADHVCMRWLIRL